MNDIETQQRFICLRSEGWSFARIADELKISKPTLTNWSRKFQFEIQNHRAINIEALHEKWLSTREARVSALGEQLHKVQAELSKRDLTSLTTHQLFTLEEALRRQIKRETGPLRFSTPSSEIPTNEFHEQVQDWNP
jgi:transcriptional regulator